MGAASCWLRLRDDCGGGVVITTATLWLLVVTSDGHRNKGSTALIERFVTVAECQRVQGHLNKIYGVQAHCIQARVAVVRP